ncbi:MAG: DUF547 domain-containing protein [Flavobacteriales bacterium]|nr:DUF547 domain-containing protein [Flavobacteriales bacterium]
MVIWHGFRPSLRMKTLFPFFLLLFSFFSVHAQEFNSFFSENVKDGLVDYSGIKKNPTELNTLLKAIANAAAKKGDDQKAFLINAYNTFVIKGIVDHYPVEGPLKVDGFFDKQTFNLRGKQVTLNQLEKEMLMKQFPDPRLHFVLVCAAKGCPKLASFAYNGKELETQLESQTRAIINDPDFIHLSGSNAQVSQIFDWYAADFGGKDHVIPFIQKYLLKKIKLNPKYSFYEYDWSLNEL